MRYRSIQSIYDETNLLCHEFCILFPEEPSSYSFTVKQGVWREAMKEEISAILKNKRWIVVNHKEISSQLGLDGCFG